MRTKPATSRPDDRPDRVRGVQPAERAAQGRVAGRWRVSVGSVAPIRIVAGASARTAIPTRSDGERLGRPSRRRVDAAVQAVDQPERDRRHEDDHGEGELEDAVHPQRVADPVGDPAADEAADGDARRRSPVRIAETACVVFPKTRTSWRDQTISSIRAAAPDRTKMARMTSGAAGDGAGIDASDLVGPVDAEAP